MKINTALILCAGLGKRLNPLTLGTPKPLLKLNNITILESCINTIIKIGVKRVILNTFHLGDQIFDFVNKKNFKIDIDIVDPEPVKLDYENIEYFKMTAEEYCEMKNLKS